MKNSKLLRPALVNIGVLAVLASLMIWLGAYGVNSRDFRWAHYWIPGTLAICGLGFKLAWPKIPGYQVGLMLLTLFVVHLALEHLGPPFLMWSELALEGICTLGFGGFWVSRGYMAKEANRWKNSHH